MGGALLAMDLGFMGPNYPINTACATGNYCLLKYATLLVFGVDLSDSQTAGLAHYGAKLPHQYGLHYWQLLPTQVLYGLCNRYLSVRQSDSWAWA